MRYTKTILTFSALTLIGSLSFAAGKTPLYNSFLETNLDAAGNTITNAGSISLAESTLADDFTGTEVPHSTWVANEIAAAFPDPPATNSTTVEFTQPRVAFDSIRANEVILDILELSVLDTDLSGGSQTLPTTNYALTISGLTSDLTITSEPSLGYPLHTNDNYQIWLSNGSDYSVTLQDEAHLTDSLLQNGGKNITLKSGQTIGFAWAAVNQHWFAMTPKGGPLANQFLGQDDTPDSYAGHALEFVRVNDGASGLEFIGGTNALSVANVVFDADFIPTTSNAFKIGSADFPIAELYVGTNSIYIGATKLSSSNGTLIVTDGTSAPTASLVAGDNVSELVNDAGYAQTEGMLVSGFSELNGFYTEDGLYNGRIQYSNAHGDVIRWNDNYTPVQQPAWYLRSTRVGNEPFYSTNIVATPDLVTTWEEWETNVFPAFVGTVTFLDTPSHLASGSKVSGTATNGTEIVNYDTMIARVPEVIQYADGMNYMTNGSTQAFTAAGGFEQMTGWQTNGNSNVTLTSSNMTVGVDGYYELRFSASFSATYVGGVHAPHFHFFKNGTEVAFSGWERTIGSDSVGAVMTHCRQQLSADDVIDCRIDVTKDSTVTWEHANFSVVRMRD